MDENDVKVDGVEETTDMPAAEPKEGEEAAAE